MQTVKFHFTVSLQCFTRRESVPASGPPAQPRVSVGSQR